MVFTNLPFLKMFSEHTSILTSIVTDLLVDEQLEVREAAGDTLGGFFHSRFASISDELVEFFRKLAKTKVKPPKNSPEASSTALPEAMYKRHGGVLGLCAVIQAFPYDVPEVVPPVLMRVCEHIHDPMPISGSVKKALSTFKRTHHDNWHDHKLKFNEDQLVTLTDVLVSPNYYA